jgi:hypothetical protein
MPRESGPNNFFRIPEASEIVGILREIKDDSLVITYSGGEVVISLVFSNILEKATDLIGQRIGILRLNDKLYIRRISDTISTSETSFTNVRRP